MNQDGIRISTAFYTTKNNVFTRNLRIVNTPENPEPYREGILKKQKIENQVDQKIFKNNLTISEKILSAKLKQIQPLDNSQQQQHQQQQYSPSIKFNSSNSEIIQTNQKLQQIVQQLDKKTEFKTISKDKTHRKNVHKALIPINHQRTQFSPDNQQQQEIIKNLTQKQDNKGYIYKSLIKEKLEDDKQMLTAIMIQQKDKPKSDVSYYFDSTVKDKTKSKDNLVLMTQKSGFFDFGKTACSFMTVKSQKFEGDSDHQQLLLSPTKDSYVIKELFPQNPGQIQLRNNQTILKSVINQISKGEIAAFNTKKDKYNDDLEKSMFSGLNVLQSEDHHQLYQNQYIKLKREINSLLENIPVGRKEVMVIDCWLEDQTKQYLESQMDDIQKILNYNLTFKLALQEIVKEVGCQCYERGVIIKKILYYYYILAIKMRDVETEIRKNLKDKYDEEYNRVHKMYQKQTQDKNELLLTHQHTIHDLNQKIKDASETVQKLEEREKNHLEKLKKSKIANDTLKKYYNILKKENENYKAKEHKSNDRILQVFGLSSNFKRNNQLKKDVTPTPEEQEYYNTKPTQQLSSNSEYNNIINNTKKEQEINHNNNIYNNNNQVEEEEDQNISSESEIVLDNEEKIVHNLDQLNNIMPNELVTTLKKKIDHKIVGIDFDDYKYFSTPKQTQTDITLVDTKYNKVFQQQKQIDELFREFVLKQELDVIQASQIYDEQLQLIEEFDGANTETESLTNIIQLNTNPDFNNKQKPKTISKIIEKSFSLKQLQTIPIKENEQEEDKTDHQSSEHEKSTELKKEDQEDEQKTQQGQHPNQLQNQLNIDLTLINNNRINNSLGHKAKFLKVLKMYSVQEVKNKIIERELADNKVLLADYQQTKTVLTEENINLKKQLELLQHQLNNLRETIELQAQKLFQQILTTSEDEENIDKKEKNGQSKLATTIKKNMKKAGTIKALISPTQIRRQAQKLSITNAPKLGQKVHLISLEQQKNQTNAGMQLVDNLKKKKLGKFKNFMPQKIVLKQIMYLYNERINQKDNPLVRESNMTRFTYNVFLNNFGFAKIADQKFIIFIMSVKKYIQVLRVNLFGRFIGLFDDNSNFTLDELNKYTDIMEYIFKVNLGFPVQINDTDSTILVPHIRAIEYVRIFSEGKLTPEEINELRNDVEKLKEIDPKGINKSGLIDFDHFTKKILAKYRIMINRTKEYVINAFKSSDLDGNGVCNLQEFLVLNRHIESENFDEEKLSKIFCDFADQVINDEVNLSFEKFAVVCCEFNLFTDSQQNKFLEIEAPEDIKNKFDHYCSIWENIKIENEIRLTKLYSFPEEDIQTWKQIIVALDTRIKNPDENEIKPLLIAIKILQKETRRFLIEQEEEEALAQIQGSQDNFDDFQLDNTNKHQNGGIQLTYANSIEEVNEDLEIPNTKK